MNELKAKYLFVVLTLVVTFLFTAYLLTYERKLLGFYNPDGQVATPGGWGANLSRQCGFLEGRARFMAVEHRGRLGNNMFLYAALKGMAMMTGRRPLLFMSFAHIQKLFALSVPFFHERDLNRSDWAVIDEFRMRLHKKPRSVIREIAGVSSDRNVILDGYFQSHYYFENVKSLLRDEFAIRETVRRQVRKTVSALLRNTSQVTTVGVHLRLGDMSLDSNSSYGLNMPPRGYFRKAMEYFLSKYPDAHFLLVTEDGDWAMKNIMSFNFTRTFIQNGTAQLDFAILASCDHVITSRGTFGWWAGWLTRGTTVYYRYFRTPNTTLSKYYPEAAYIPRDKYNHWIAIGH